MIILRYCGLVQVYHWLTFYKQKPWAFLLGVILFPYHVISRLVMYPPDMHKEVVLNSITVMKNYWKLEGAIPPPSFVRRKFLALEQELKS